MLTDGEQPVHVFDAFGDTAVPVPPQPPVADTTGAGDAFAAGYIDRHLAGGTPVEAVRHANSVAARFLAGREAMVGPTALAAEAG